MKLILHILWKDIRQLRWLLLLWYGLSVLQIVIVSIQYPAMSFFDPSLAILNSLMLGLQFLAFATLLLLISRLVQEDSLTGTTAFWMTRPISRQTLLTAKFLFVFGILILPMTLLDACMLLYNQVTIKDAVIILGETLLTQKLVWCFLIMALASLTPNLSRLAIACILLAVLLVALLYVSINLNILFAVEQSAVLLMSTVAIVFSLIIIIHQFLTRKTVRSASIVVIGALFWITAAQLIPVNFFAVQDDPVNPAVFDSSPVELTLAGHLVYNSYYTLLGGRSFFYGGFIFSNVEKGFFLQPVSAHTSLAFSDGVTLTHHPNNYTRQVIFHQMPEKIPTTLTRNLESTLGNIRILNPGEDTTNVIRTLQLFALDNSLYQKYRNQPGVLKTKVKVQVSKYRIAAELPLRVGSRLDRGSSHFTITNIERSPDGIAVTMNDKYPDTIFVNNQLKRSYTLLVNRDTKQALMGRQERGGSYSFVSRIPPNKFPFSTINNTRTYNPPDGSGIRIDDSWLRNAKILLIDKVILGTFEKELEVENFRMSGQSAKQ
jgi:hypothetical protein